MKNLTGSLSLLFLLLLGALPGCPSRSVGDANANHNRDAGPAECQDLFDCNPGVQCGELVMCEAGSCRPDLGHVIIPCTFDECTSDGDCVVAVPMTCCFGCPEVMSRATLAQTDCYFDEDTTPGPLPPECQMECYYCPDCAPQPLGARCDDGLCVPTELGCPDLSETPLTAVTTNQVVLNAAAHDGQVRRIRGTVMPGEGSCDGEGCSATYRSLLNGVVRLDGYLCDVTVGLTGDECRANLVSHAAQSGGWYEFEGIVHESPSQWEPPWLEVTGSRLIDPEDMGGHYPAVITGVESDANDPTCVPAWWTVGTPVDVYLARSDQAVTVVAPALHCEANFSGNVDNADPTRFDSLQPADCIDCNFMLNGQITADQLTAKYIFDDGSCRHIVTIEGTRVLF